MIDCDGSFSRCRRLYSIVALPTDGAETSIDQRRGCVPRSNLSVVTGTYFLDEPSGINVETDITPTRDCVSVKRS